MNKAVEHTPHYAKLTTKCQATICSVSTQSNPYRSPIKVIARTYRQEKLQSMCNLASRQGRGKSSGSAPSADTVSDTTERLEVVPVRELVVFRGGRHVCANDADREVWDFGDGDFGAVEL
jgi:hypothetical protein